MPPNSTKSQQPSIPPSIPDEISLLRTSLYRQLAMSGKASFYQYLELTPECTDDQVASAVAAIQAKVGQGEFVSPELRYAIEALKDPASRAAYDHKLLEMLTKPNILLTASSSLPALAEESIFLLWWNSHKVSIVIGLTALLLFGVLSLNFIKEVGRKEIAVEVVANQKQAIQVTDNTNSFRAQTERQVVEGYVENQAAAINSAAEIASRQEDRLARELEHRASYDAAQLEIQQAKLAEQKKQVAVFNQARENALVSYGVPELERQLNAAHANDILWPEYATRGDSRVTASIRSRLIAARYAAERSALPYAPSK